MNKLRNLMRFVPRGNKLAAVLYVVFFAALFLRIIVGVGEYWDWAFPYYVDQIGNYFSRSATAWTETANGSPLGYSSDYLFRFGVSLFGWLKPELLVYLLVLALYTTGAYGTYLIARKHTKAWIAFLLGLAAFVNPAMFYKFTAGHMDYMVSYVLLIYMVYFLLYRFRSDMRSAIVVGLMLALIGVQIQFLVIAAALVALFFFFRPDMWRWKFLAPLLLLPLLINLVWLSNFLVGGADIASLSGEATKASFKASSNSDYLNIFSFSFSKATLISRFYSVYELLLYGLIFVLMVVALLKSRRKQVEDVWLLSFLLVILFLATGLFQLINLGPLTTLYPMFREVGHFAPIIVLLMIVLLGRLMPRGAWKVLVVVWLVLVIGISFVKYQADAQTISYASARQQFAEFKQFGDAHPSKDERVLSYPFFDQYAFTALPMRFQDNLPLRNSGHDSFAEYSSQQFVQNAIKPLDFKSSVQHRLLQTMDVNILKPYNVHYIYDLSGVYESYYERYVPPSTYDGDLSWIKNNPYFLDQLLQANPGKLKRVSAHILEVTGYPPRIATTDKLYSVNTAANGEDTRAFMEKTFPNQSYDYIDQTVSIAPAGSGSVTPLFSDARAGMVDAARQSLNQMVNLDQTANAQLYSSSVPSIVTYQAHNGIVTFYAASTGKLYVNGKLVQDNDASPPQLLGRIQMPTGRDFYIGLEGNIMPLRRDGTATIGHLNGGSTLELYTATSNNLVANPSFESDLWNPTVGDCNAYDKSPDIGMKLDASMASNGKNSLQLTARRHDACTSANVDLKGNTTYLLSYDYQSPNADTASFYLRFNNSDNGAIKRFQSIADANWHTTTQPIVTPDVTTSGQLFVHSLASDRDTPNVNRYDNFRLIELQKVGETSIDVPNNTYTKQPVGATGQVPFSFVDSSYDYANVVSNGSFEKGLWQSKVQDCNNYDKSPSIAMNLDKSAKTDGGQSLRLDAAAHAACTYTNVNVQSGTDYLLSFDYRSDTGGQLGYYVQFDGSDGGSQDRISPPDHNWHTYTAKVHVPALTTSLRLYLHAYETNGTTNNTVHFDNVGLVAIPTLAQQYYVVSDPQTAMQQPQGIAFHTDSESHRTIQVSGAKGAFALLLSESYHPAWQLELQNGAAQGWLPGGGVTAVGAHFESSGYANGWYIDPAELCKGNPQGCRKNADGSYALQLVAEFVPQRWFTVNRLLSVGALLLSGGYVALTHRRVRELQKMEGVYRHPLAHRPQRKGKKK
jgi:hypothetical protein